MPTSRQQVLDYIRAQRVVSAGELSRALQMTEANARHHLALLSAQGLVSQVGKRPAQRKGRPIKLYGLSAQVAGNNMDRLVEVLLDDLTQDLPQVERQANLTRIAHRLLNCSPGAGLEMPPGATLTQRLLRAVRWLNQFHYDARWEAHVTAPRLILGRCPYAAVIDDHPELCLMDRALLEDLAGVSIEQKTKLQLDRRGIRQCVFVLQSK